MPTGCDVGGGAQGEAGEAEGVGGERGRGGGRRRRRSEALSEQQAATLSVTVQTAQVTQVSETGGVRDET